MKDQTNFTICAMGPNRKKLQSLTHQVTALMTIKEKRNVPQREALEKALKDLLQKLRTQLLR